MVWTGQQFAQRHNHSLTPEQAAHAARIANAILGRTGNEGESIATANRLVHRDIGGPVDPGTAQLSPFLPNVESQNPLQQGMMQRYTSMSPEQLQELSVRMRGSPQSGIIDKVLEQKKMKTASQPQQAAPALSLPNVQAAAPQEQKRGGMTKRAPGGMMPASEASPWWERREASSSAGSGFLHGASPGRADAVHTTAPGGSYVLPADVISGIGEGNSLAGASATERMLKIGPYGTAMPRAGGHTSFPRPPAAPKFEAGGETYGYVPKAREWHGPKLYRAGGVMGEGGDTPVALSDGEYIVGPPDVARLGKGNHAAGIRRLDRFVVEQRRKHIKRLKTLPGPVKVAA